MPLVEQEPEAWDPMLWVAVAATAAVVCYWAFFYIPISSLTWALLNSVGELCIWAMAALMVCALLALAAVPFFALHSLISAANEKSNKRVSNLRKLCISIIHLVLHTPWAQLLLILGITDTLLPFLPISTAVKRTGQKFDFPDTVNTRLLLWGATSALVQCVHMAVAAALLPSDGPSPTTWLDWLLTLFEITKAAATSVLHRPQPKPQPQRRNKPNQSSTDSNRAKSRSAASSNSKASTSAASATPTRTPPTKPTPSPAARTTPAKPSPAPSAFPPPAAAPGPSPHAPSRKNSKKGKAALRNKGVPPLTETTSPEPSAPSGSSLSSPPAPPDAPTIPDAPIPAADPQVAAATAPAGQSSWLGSIRMRLGITPAAAPQPPPAAAAAAAAAADAAAPWSDSQSRSASDDRCANSGDSSSTCATPAAPPVAPAEPPAGPPAQPAAHAVEPAAPAAAPIAPAVSPAAAAARAAPAVAPAAAAAAAAAAPQPASTSSTPTADEDMASFSCVVCLEAPADAGFLHETSLHQCICRSCAAAFKVGGECPLCRQPIERVVNVFAITG